MASITAVELGADICASRAYFRARRRDPRARPPKCSIPRRFRASRRSRSPCGRPAARCSCRGGAAPSCGACPTARIRKDAGVKPLLAPLTAAGFRVERVVSPCNALAALARAEERRAAKASTCWLAINRGGVAIVVVRPGKLLYAHSFVWDSIVGSERQPGAPAAALFARLVPLARDQARDGGSAQARHAGRRGRHLRQSARSPVADDAAHRGARRRGRDARLARGPGREAAGGREARGVGAGDPARLRGRDRARHAPVGPVEEARPVRRTATAPAAAAVAAARARRRLRVVHETPATVAGRVRVGVPRATDNRPASAGQASGASGVRRIRSGECRRRQPSRLRLR